MWISWVLFSLRGRLRRRDWWLGSIALGLVQLVGDGMIYARSYPDVGPSAMFDAPQPPAAMALGLLMLWPSIALSVKRVHDRDGSGWSAVAILTALTVIGLLPELFPALPDLLVTPLNLTALAGALYLLVVLGFSEGTPGDNRFGPPPRAPL